MKRLHRTFKYLEETDPPTKMGVADGIDTLRGPDGYSISYQFSCVSAH